MLERTAPKDVQGIFRMHVFGQDYLMFDRQLSLFQDSHVVPVRMSMSLNPYSTTRVMIKGDINDSYQV